jgi:hypothetical protein
MRLEEIYNRYPRRGDSGVYDAEAINLDYEKLMDSPPTEKNPKAWMPDMETQPEYATKFHYEYEPAERGSRERGSGLQLEPDYSENVSIVGAEIFDPRVNRWIEVFAEDYFSNNTIEHYEHEILDDLEVQPPEPDYDPDY